MEVVLWIGGVLYGGSCGVIRSFVARDERDGVDEH